jgi:hypothetical protein
MTPRIQPPLTTGTLQAGNFNATEQALIQALVSAIVRELAAQTSSTKAA